MVSKLVEDSVPDGNQPDELGVGFDPGFMPGNCNLVLASHH